jgi:hypothetical protein
MRTAVFSNNRNRHAVSETSNPAGSTPNALQTATECPAGLQIASFGNRAMPCHGSFDGAALEAIFGSDGPRNFLVIVRNLPVASQTDFRILGHDHFL